jgi:hypothetical protein
MIKVKLRSRLVLQCAAVAVAIGLAAPVMASPGKTKRPVQQAPAAAAAPTAKPLDFARIDALRGVVVAFIGERECDDLSVDYSRLDRRLKQAGLKPDDVGPHSPYGEQLDLIRREVFETFLDNRRRACEHAWDLVGESDKAEQAPSAARLGRRQSEAGPTVSPFPVYR